MDFNFLKIIKQAIQAVPEVKWALGVAGIFAVVALAVFSKVDLRISLWGTLVLIGLMVLLLIFARLSQLHKSAFEVPSKILMWFFMLLFIITCLLLFTSVFFKVPVNLQFVLLNEEKTALVDSVQQKPTIASDTVRYIGVNYMRLFGAVEVPMLMKILEREPELTNDSNSNYGSDYYFLKGWDKPIHRRLVSFWREKWEFKNATALKTPLWMNYVGNQQMGINTYWTALSPNLKDYITFTKHGDIDEYGMYTRDLSDSLGLGLSDYQIENTHGMESTDVGFTFLILSNTTDNPLREIELSFQDYKNPLTILERDEWKGIKTFDPATVALNEEKINFSKPQPPNSIKISLLEPHQSVIWILNVYRRDKDFLPKFYLSDVSIPINIKFDTNNHTFHEKIRPPYGKSAARLDIPSGWFGQ